MLSDDADVLANAGALDDADSRWSRRGDNDEIRLLVPMLGDEAENDTGGRKTVLLTTIGVRDFVGGQETVPSVSANRLSQLFHFYSSPFLRRRSNCSQTDDLFLKA